MKPAWITLAILFFAAAGCGTSKWTDTGRSATEQLLITDAMDRAVSDLDFRALAGKTSYIDSTALKRITDSEYLVSCMRQHMLASGCIVKDNKAEADYVVEVRAGAVGTDHHDVLYGVPAVNIPTVVPVTGIPSQIPEMPIVKKTDQRAVVKLSVFAYNQKTGRPIWQSGAVPEESDARAVWVLGAGPFQRGTIYDGMEFAGDTLDIPLIDVYHPERDHVSVADEAYFTDPEDNVEQEQKTETAIAANGEKKESEPMPQAEESKPASVIPAGHAEPPANAEPETPTSTPPPSPAPPAAPGREPVKTTKPSETAPVSPAAKTTDFAPNDLAPALTAFPYETAPQLLRSSGSVQVPSPIPPPLDGPILPLPNRFPDQP